MKDIVLAYSGGLDTSYCVKYLSEEGYTVHAVSVNTGGFDEKEIEEMKNKALKLGASSFECLDRVQEFYDKVIKYLIFGNVLKNQTYPLSVSAERIVQAMALAEHAKKIGAGYIAHGSTGAGNDQVRFDGIFQVVAPEIEIITPIRDQQLSREQEIEYLSQKGVDMSWNKAKYSINKGLWGTSVGGAETLGSKLPLPEEAFPSQLQNMGTEQVKLSFEKGELTAINGQQDSPVNLILKLQDLASSFAIGRDIHVGDTIIGIKGRVGFEAAAPLVIIKAHHLLEKHVLTKWQQQHKEYLANWYGMLLHEGQYTDEVMRNIEAFLTDAQKQVTGDVWVSLYPYRFTLDGIESPFDMMQSDFGSYGEMNKQWSAQEAKGFIKIHATGSKIAEAVKNKAS
ncbi:argininosuccinate synthase [Robertkochia aurantiaca]|uniref:argininosuccinate synthase n=1 Tax=Robertkochia aurantiaca TaxID=2873700 RepID=UPI001CCAC9A7|nr:argininosuccinate synthase [Robertkochia sp. 3YJGBD-33]